MTERDWKILREVSRLALERFCERVLQECASVTADHSRTAHERYLKLFRLIEKRDREVARAFNDLRRSTAIQRLIAMHHLGVVTEEEMERFSLQTRETVEALSRFR